MNRLNNISYNIPEIVNYLNTGTLPTHLNTQKKVDNYIDTFSQFTTHNNNLFYETRQVIDDNDKNDVLT